jgi:crotonobetainyl-CoA:carnitine CoA-transferase CaiB-like acyl-CoA transferase
MIASGTRAPTSSDGAPLAHLTVVETAVEPGARYCGRLFSVLGARVIRVGQCADLNPETGAAAFQTWLDEGKSVAPTFADACAHLGAPPDAVVAGQTREAVAGADAEIAALSLNTLRLGLTWFGDHGPYAQWKGDDALIQALIGVAHGFGEADGPPTIPQGHAPQLIAGATLFMAGLAALWGRLAGRDDRRVDVDILEAALCFSETAPPMFERAPGKARRGGINRFAVNHPMTVYKTRDGWLGVTALTPAQWAALAALIGHPEWSEDPRFRTSLDRVAHAEVIDAELQRILPTRTTDEWLLDGQTLRIPLAPVPRHKDLLETDHWRQRGSFTPFRDDAGLKPRLMGPRLPFRIAWDDAPRDAPTSAGIAPLSGLRVIDFSMGWAGPLCTRHLADLGADVIKIESESHYDWWRGWEPPGACDPPDYELRPVFNVMNRGKRGVCLDLTTADGAAQAKRLVAAAHLVIENFAPGVMAKLGLGSDVLSKVRPGLIMVSMGAFGAAGPWRFFRAYGSTVEHASGMPHVNGEAAWPPCLQHGAYGDPVAGVYAAGAALAALHGRRLGGAWIDLAQVECLFQLGADALIAAQVDGEPARLGSRSLHLAPRCVVATADPEDYVAVTVRGDDDWRGLCGALGRPDWAEDPRMATPAGRNAHASEIEAALALFCARYPSAAEAAAALQTAGAPAAPVVPSHRLTRDPQAMARGTWMSLERRHVGRHIMAAPPYRLNGERPRVSRPAPLLGEHTQEVLAELDWAHAGSSEEPAVAEAS